MRVKEGVCNECQLVIASILCVFRIPIFRYCKLSSCQPTVLQMGKIVPYPCPNRRGLQRSRLHRFSRPCPGHVFCRFLSDPLTLQFCKGQVGISPSKQNQIRFDAHAGKLLLCIWPNARNFNEWDTVRLRRT